MFNYIFISLGPFKETTIKFLLPYKIVFEFKKERSGLVNERPLKSTNVLNCQKIFTRPNNYKAEYLAKYNDSSGE